MSGATYSSQTKERLSSNVTKEVENMVYPALLDFFNKNPSEASKIINKARVVAEGREQFKLSVRSLTSMKKTGSGVLFLPNILASAPDATPDTRALYIVEGESAAGCFHIDTPIRLADGSTITFKQMLSGPKEAEYIGLSYNDVEHKQTKELCCDVRITKYVTQMLEFHMSDGSVFRCTDDHPFLCYDTYQYLPAYLFKNGAKVQSAFGDVGYDSLRVVRVSEVCFSVPQPVCDLTMHKHHNFVLANGMVVHNSAKKARDSSYQEVLELRGKLINAAKMPLVRLLASQPVRSIILSLGVDLSLVDADSIAFSDSVAKSDGTVDSTQPKPLKRPPDIFPTANMRVKHIYILSDQDPDGSHIAVLALTLLWRFFPTLFYQGRVWVVTAKLYHAYHNGHFYFGDTHDECAAKMPSNVPKSAIVRAKGLAEYNPNVLRYVAFDRNTMSVARIFPPKDMDGYSYFESLVGKDTKARKTLLGLV
jgi:DNA gyrase subunit B